MSTSVLDRIPHSPISPAPIVNSTYSPQSTTHEEYYTPQLSIHDKKLLSDSDSTLTDHTLSGESDDEDFYSILGKKHVQFATPAKRKVSIQVKLENDEAEFFASVSFNDTISNGSPEKIKSPRKRDKIRSLFQKKFHGSNHGSFESNPNEWNEVLAKSLISMHDDIEDIINGFDQIDPPAADSLMPTGSESILTTPHLSFRERQRAKLHLIRMAQMLHPPNLLTYDVKESPYPYTDIIEPRNFNLLRIKDNNLLGENLLIQHKPFQHKKFRYRTQRGLLRMRHDLKKIKQDLYGKSRIKIHKELPSLGVQNYRNRLEKTLLEVRTQIAEYDRIHAIEDTQRPSISHIIAKIKGLDPNIKSRIEDYRTKLRPIEFIETKQKSDLISAPFIPRRARYRPNIVKKETVNQVLDTRFDPTTFVDLQEESEIFYGCDLPFWNQTHPDPLSSTSAPAIRRRSNQFTLPPKTGLIDRFIYAFKVKQQCLRDAQSLQTSDENEKRDEFFDCSSLLSQQRKSQSILSPNDKQSISILVNDQDNTDSQKGI